MNNFPDFSNHGYQVERELGHNRTNGRVTYLATNANTQHVVIKQFQFAQSGSSWSGYDAYQREIQVLQQLKSPSIPRYLNSFETPTGFCLVQEYKKAPSLAQPRYWTPEEIKQIAVAVLKVLAYLQHQNPPVIHRDIKPENILVNRQGTLKVYLVDFGFARMGGGEVAASSSVKGTLGFMPPEQLFNRQLTEASDLYSLGATLICLLTQTKSTEIGNLINEDYRFNLKQLVPLSPQFIDWLQKMVAPNLKNRYPNAIQALAALRPIDVDRTTTRLRLVHAAKPWVIAPTVGLATLISIAFSTTFIKSAKTDYPEKIENLSKIEIAQYLGKIKNAKKLTKIENAGDAKQLLETNSCTGCDLRGANLEDTDLTYADLVHADLRSANLKGANLSGADLRLTNLKGANLSGAILNATLVGANLRDANLSKANLFEANLWSANLRGAKLKDANLRKAILDNANLAGADLTGADLRGAGLKGAIMPDGSIHK